MTYKIEKNVPLYPTRPTRGINYKYPLGDMEIGDSFFVPGSKHSTVNGPIQGFRLRNPGTKFSCRMTDDGIRVWRIK